MRVAGRKVSPALGSGKLQSVSGRLGIECVTLSCVLCLMTSGSFASTVELNKRHDYMPNACTLCTRISSSSKFLSDISCFDMRLKHGATR
jgi:hypothetical protein